MSIFNPNTAKPVNNNSVQKSSNYPKVEASRDTEFGTIDPKNNKLIQYNLLEASINKENHNTTNIRTTLTELAIRNNKFNFYSGKFDANFPGNYVYSFCNPELSIVFQNGATQYTRKITNDSGYPLDITIEKVYDSIQNNIYGKNYSGNCSGCPGNVPPDPITGLCTTTKKCVPDPIEPCPEPELINLKSTIYGYAFYLDTIRKIDIPNIGERLVRCAGGHACNRTHFRPILKLSDSSIVQPSNNISLDNINGILPSLYSVPQYNPIAFQSYSNFERSDTFTFSVNDTSLLDNTCEVYLECLSSGGYCHNDVTMIFLVGQRSDNDEFVLIFADCVAPGNINAKFLGSVPCNDDLPTDCEPPPPPPTPPPPDCDYLTKTKANVTFTGFNMPLESMGDQGLIDQIALLVNNGPHEVSLINVDEFGFSADQYLIGTVAGSIYILLFINGTTDGLGNINISITLNILQTASPYPYVYSASFIDSVPSDNLCNFNNSNGTHDYGEGGGTVGVSVPAYTSDGSDSVSVDFE